MNGGTLSVLYIQDDRYFGSLYGLETHDKKENAEPEQKMIFSQAKVFCTSELNLLKISSLKAFFHIPLLYSKHPVNNILQELINQEKKNPHLCFGFKNIFSWCGMRKLVTDDTFPDETV